MLARGQLVAALPDLLPKGVAVVSDPRGLMLVGKRLRMRFITDPRLRAISALAQGLMR